MDGQQTQYIVADETHWTGDVELASVVPANPFRWTEIEVGPKRLRPCLDAIDTALRGLWLEALDPRYGFVPDTFKSVRALNE